MGCAASSIDKEERVRICKERKRIMKQLLGVRAEFANAILAYLKALKNTGGTLKQFTESESFDPENVAFSVSYPPSPRLLRPPPPLPFSSDSRKDENQSIANAQEEIIDIDKDGGSSSQHNEMKRESMEEFEEENWAETRTQFEEDYEEDEMNADRTPSLPKRMMSLDVSDENSSITSTQMKNPAAMPMVVWRSKKTLPGIIRELDSYFLKASDGGKEISILIDINTRISSLHCDSKENKKKFTGKGSNKVLSSLSRSWSSRLLQPTKDTEEGSGPSEPCRPGAHCITLKKLYAEELMLYKAVKDAAIAKLEHERKSLSLQKRENENSDLNKIEKIRFAVENLQSDIARLRELISRTCSSILTLVDKELQPQLVALLSGLAQMWRSMYQCHKVQNYISEQVKHLANHPSTDPTTEFHREATAQLKTEVNFWYSSFCRLAKSQRDYVGALYKWILLTDSLVDNENRNLSSFAVRDFCEQWQLALDKLPEQSVSEAIKTFLSVIHAISLRQEQEFNLKRRSDKLERRLHKEKNALLEMEKKLKTSVVFEEGEPNLSPKHPLYLKRAKTIALNKRYEDQKAKYMKSVQVSRAMTLNNLIPTLPNVFMMLMGFSSACAQAFDAVLIHAHRDSGVEEASDTVLNHAHQDSSVEEHHEETN